MVWGREVEKRVGSVLDAVAVIGADDGIDLPGNPVRRIDAPTMENRPHQTRCIPRPLPSES